MAKTSKHVAPHYAGGWAVRSFGATRASKVFDTQQEAVACGHEAARRAGTALYIHARDGVVESRTSYGHDPLSPRDRC